MRRTKGFTLVELLVVISIIALLLSILMPSLSKARAQAKAVVCKSRAAQWLLAASMYSTDNMGYCSNDSGLLAAKTYKLGFWFTQWAPYLTADNFVKQSTKDYQTDADIDDIEILRCPSARKASEGFYTDSYQMSWGSSTKSWSYVGFEGGYGLNSWLTQDIEKVWSAFAGRSMKQRLLNRPFEWARFDVPVIADAAWTGGAPIAEYPDPVNALGPQSILELGSGKNRFYIDRHENALTIAFGDTHVEKVTLNEIWNQKWHKRWNFYKK